MSATDNFIDFKMTDFDDTFFKKIHASFRKVQNADFIANLTPNLNTDCVKCGGLVRVGQYVCEACAMPGAELKVYLALISWDGGFAPPRIPSKTNPPNIEMTILALTMMSAGDKVREILGDDGYAVDDVNFLLHLREIEGPFKAGFVISRNGG